jgi:hypothetical protein
MSAVFVQHKKARVSKLDILNDEKFQLLVGYIAAQFDVDAVHTSIYKKINDELQNGKLNLYGVGLTSKDIKLMVIPLLKVSPLITELELGNNNIGYKGVKALAEMLAETNISKLSLKFNLISNRGCIALANCNLERIDVDSVQCENRGALALARNPNLKEVDISQNKNINNNAIQEFVRNQKIRELRIRNIDINDETATMLANSKNIRVLSITNYKNTISTQVLHLFALNEHLVELNFPLNPEKIPASVRTPPLDAALKKSLEEISANRVQSFNAQKNAFLLGTQDRVGADSAILRFSKTAQRSKVDLGNLIFSYIKPRPFKLISE